MSNNNMKRKVLSGLFWRYGERICAQGVSLIVSVILARILTPADYSIIPLIMVFISLANVIITAGFGTALVQKKDADRKDFSTIFYFNGMLSLIVYGVLFFVAPYVAKFYDIPLITPVFRVFALTLVIGAFNTIQHTYVQKTMQFKRFFVSTLFGTIVSAFVGIWMAHHGFGVWALVAQHMTNQIIDTLVLFFTVKWRPMLYFSVTRLKALFGFGSKMLLSSIINAVYNNIHPIVIGKVYSPESIAFYDKGKKWPHLIMENLDGSINQVLLPAYSEMQDNRQALKGMMRRAISLSSYLVFPCMIGLAAVARPFILVVLTEKWLPSVPFIRFCCFTYALWPIHTANLQAIKAVGRSDIVLKLEIAKKVVGITFLAISIPFGIYAMMIGTCISATISSFLNASPNKKLFDYSYFEQMKDLLPTIVISLIMGVAAWSISLINMNLYLMLILQVITGVVVYIGLSTVFKLEPFKYILKQLYSMINAKKRISNGYRDC